MEAVLAFPPQREPAFVRSFLLAAAVHAVLIGVMFLGVRFQSYAPDTVEVELWETQPQPEPQPRIEPPKPPPPQVEPERPAVKPDIALREKPKPKPKPKAEPPKSDPAFEKRMREQLAMEQKAVAEQQLRELIARQERAARNSALAAWTDKIKSRIRSRIPVQVAQAVPGNPEAVFNVSLLPTGEVLTVRMTRSSGNKPYDEAVERAIMGASPLPKPDDASLFQRQLELRFRPQDKPGS